VEPHLDQSTAATLQFFGKELLTSRFLLRALVKRRRQIERDELATKQRIVRLEARLNRELSRIRPQSDNRAADEPDLGEGQ
jgi:hypothetical protein